MPNTLMNRSQQLLKCKSGHLTHLRKRKNKGVSSLIGMTFFIIILTVSIVYVFLWTQNTSNYADVVKTEMDLSQQRAAEMLDITVTNRSGQINVEIANPTPDLIVVRQIWNSSHSLIWNDNLTIPSFTSHTIYDVSSSDANLKVITFRGNIFYSSLAPNPLTVATNETGHWDVLFWIGTTNSSSPIYLGSSTWYELSFSRVYGRSISWGAQPGNETFGFNAITRVQLINTTEIDIGVGLDSPYESANQITISLSNSTGIVYGPKSFNSSTFIPIINLNPASKYFIQVGYVNNATSILPQTVTLTIVGADFG